MMGMMGMMIMMVTMAATARRNDLQPGSLSLEALQHRPDIVPSGRIGTSVQELYPTGHTGDFDRNQARNQAKTPIHA
jgi:hypothetical protein